LLVNMRLRKMQLLHWDYWQSRFSNVFHRSWPGSSRELSFVKDFLE
jgi:hypothetical protein